MTDIKLISIGLDGTCWRQTIDERAKATLKAVQKKS